MAMLLGAGKYLAKTCNLAGSVAVLFQPAEEGGDVSNKMVKDSLMDRFGISAVRGLLIIPNMAVCHFAI
jgi:hippurate hydrolase